MKIIRVQTVEEGNAILKEHTSRGEGCVFLQNSIPEDSKLNPETIVIALMGIVLPESWETGDAMGPGDESENEDDEDEDYPESEDEEITASFADLTALRDEIALQAKTIAELRSEVSDLRNEQRKEYRALAEEAEKTKREHRAKLAALDKTATRESAHARAAARAGRTFLP